MSLPDLAIDRQLEQIAVFRGHIGGRLSEMLMDQHLGEDPVKAIRPWGMNWVQFGNEVSNLLNQAPTYAVTTSMLEVIEHGVKTMTQEEPLPLKLDSQTPRNGGFVWFESPHPWLTINPDANDEARLPVEGLWWLPSGMVQVDDEMRQGIISGVVVHKSQLLKSGEGEGLPPRLTSDLTGWAVDSPWTEAESYEDYRARYPEDHHVVAPSGAYWRRWLLAFWALCDGWVEVLPASRQARRRADRGQLPESPNYGDVRVITLRRRRTKDSEPAEEAYEWSHRWWVNGHWRWQACGEGRKDRKLIWVAPYVKGPDDKPLIVRDDVRVLKR